jgi:putative ABC transport system permease protein
MISHLVKLAFRNLWNDRMFSFINVIGLTVGFTCVLIISLWIKNEISYDRQHGKAERIYRLTVEVNNPDGYHAHFARSWQEWITQMPGQFSSIETMARFSPLGRTAININEEKFNTERVFRGNQEVLKVFDFSFIEGKPEEALKSPKQVILSESLAEQYFGNDDVSGKTLDMSGIWDTVFVSYLVTGVFKDFPAASHFHPEILVSMDNPDTFTGWAYTYFMLHKGQGPGMILDNFRKFSEKFLPEDQREISTIHLQKLTDIHLNSHKDREIEVNGNSRTVLVFTVTGIIIFLISLVNFINISLALVMRRRKGILVHKIFGAKHGFIFSELFAEAVILSFVSSLVSLVLVLFAARHIPEFFDPGYVARNLPFLFVCTAILMTICALIVSSFRFMFVNVSLADSGLRDINSGLPFKLKNQGIRAMLVVFQFTASLILIVSSIYFNRQKNYMFDNRLGSRSDPIVVLDNLNWIVKGKYFEFRNKLLPGPAIRDVTGIMEEPSGQTMDAMPFLMSGITAEKKDLVLYVCPADANFLSFFDLELAGGNNFAPYDPESGKEEYIINETAMKFLGYKTPDDVIGREFKPVFYMEGIFKGGTIVGVVRDFHFSTLKEKIKPLVFFPKPIWYGTFMVKVDSARISDGIRHIKSVWEEVYPEHAFDYFFVDQLYKKAYSPEILQARLSNFFMVLAMVLACLGLFGIASISIEQRNREIGIRKTVGASAGDIIFMLNREFLFLILISIAIALPLSWYLMKSWSGNYAYKAELSWWIFVLAAGSCIMIPLITISYMVIKASLKNPVEILRCE